MSLSAAAAALIGSGITAGSNLGNMLIQGRQNEKQREWQEGQSELSYNREVDFWHKQNEYNSPKAQMERLKEAGINPRLAFSGGTVENQAGTTLPKYNEPKGKFDLPPIDPTQILGAFNSLRSQNANIKLTQEQAESLRIENDLKEYLMPYRKAQEGVNKSSLQQVQVEQYKLENAFKRNRNDLAKMGIYSSDNILLRIAYQTANEMGYPIDAMIKTMLKKYMPKKGKPTFSKPKNPAVRMDWNNL